MEENKTRRGVVGVEVLGSFSRQSEKTSSLKVGESVSLNQRGPKS